MQAFASSVLGVEAQSWLGDFGFTAVPPALSAAAKAALASSVHKDPPLRVN